MNTGPVRLRWTANTESDLAGYLLHYGRASGVYDAADSPIDVGSVTTYIVTIHDEGNWFFALKAYDTTAQESDFSSELTGTFTHVRPTFVAQRGIFKVGLR